MSDPSRHDDAPAVSLPGRGPGRDPTRAQGGVGHDPVTVRVTRGGHVESVHRVHVVVCDAKGEVIRTAGDPGFATFLRSAAKPFQALPLVEDGVVDALEISDRELALCCASHSSQAEHVAVARSLLARAGLDEGALACGGHPPLSSAEARRLCEAGIAPGPIESNCSGKHAGMLALASFHGWSTTGYHLPDHPVQRRMLREVARWTGLDPDEVETGVDGCGVVCFRVPLHRVAAAIARFAATAAEGRSAGRLAGVMMREPEMVAGRGRLCTALLRTGAGSLVAKTGAEGVYVVGSLRHGAGFALKVEDGTTRAAEAAAVAVAEALEWVSPGAEALTPWRRRVLTNTRDESVGVIEAELPWGDET